MEKKITQELLKELGIYELRELARQVGVESPTTKKRSELCDNILRIYSGEVQPANSNPNKGRPPKSVSRVLSIVQEVFPKELANLKTPKKHEEISFSNILKFSQNQLAGIILNDERSVEGYVKIYMGKFYLMNKEVYPFNSTKVIYIPNNFIDELSLREGDKIEGYANLIKNDEECGILAQINLINGNEIAKHIAIRQNLNTNIAFKTDKTINIFNQKINKGSRILTTFPSSQSASEFLINKIDNDESNTKFIFVGADLAPEDLFFIQSRQKINKFLTGFGQDLKLISKNIDNALNYAETLLKDGNEIIFVIFDVCKLLNSLDMLFANDLCGEYHNHKVNSILLIKKLIGAGRAISDEVSLTTISVAFDKDKNNEFLSTDLNEIINVKIEN